LNYYCLGCQSGSEDINIRQLKATFFTHFPSSHLEAYSPRKDVKEFKAKSWHMVNQPMLPGYIIIETDEDLLKIKPELRRLTDTCYGLVRTVEKDYRLRYKDREYAVWICSLGGLVTASKVMKVINVEEGDKIVVLSGPMKDFKGKIVSIYKGTRATCEFEFLGETKRVNLLIELVETQEEDCPETPATPASDIIRESFESDDK